LTKLLEIWDVNGDKEKTRDTFQSSRLTGVRLFRRGYNTANCVVRDWRTKDKKKTKIKNVCKLLLQLCLEVSFQQANNDAFNQISKKITAKQ